MRVDIWKILFIYMCGDKDLEAGSRTRILRAPPAELEIHNTVDAIGVLRLHGAPTELQTVEAVDETEVRSSNPLKPLRKSML